MPPPKKPNRADNITIYFDGIYHEFPPHDSAWSFIAHLNGQQTFKDSGPIPNLPEFSGNDLISRFIALREALKWMVDRNWTDHYCAFRNDSRMVIESFTTNRPAPENETIRQLWQECRYLLAPYTNANFLWIPKAENRECRVLSLFETGVRV